MNVKKKDILKLVAYFRVYGLDLYSVKHHGYDTGKNNLESYFCGKLNWAPTRLNNVVSFLTKEGVLRRERVDHGCKCFSMGSLYKSILRTIETEDSILIC